MLKIKKIKWKRGHVQLETEGTVMNPEERRPGRAAEYTWLEFSLHSTVSNATLCGFC